MLIAAVLLSAYASVAIFSFIGGLLAFGPCPKNEVLPFAGACLAWPFFMAVLVAEFVRNLRG